MKSAVTSREIDAISSGYDPRPGHSHSLHAEAYTDPRWFDLELEAILARSWRWICHVEALREPGSFVATEVAGRPVFVVRDLNGGLRAFYNVCKHRAHELLQGAGRTRRITCPYHAWTYDLSGQLVRAPGTEKLAGFDPSSICLTPVRVEEFCGFVYLNLDSGAKPLSEQSGNLSSEIHEWAANIGNLTFAHRLNYDIRSNWKTVVDNFLECYHCPVAHKDFCTLVDMDSYRVTTHGIYSSHMAEAGNSPSAAYPVEDATVRVHAVWWLWPTTCLMRYPGHGNFLVMNIIPAGPERTLETYDFYFETAEPTENERQAIRYVNEVLQVEDISLVESVQRGMKTPAFRQGRIVHDGSGSGQSELAVHHFHGLVLDAYSRVKHT